MGLEVTKPWASHRVMEGTFFLAFWTEIQIKSYSGGQSAGQQEVCFVKKEETLPLSQVHTINS